MEDLLYVAAWCMAGSAVACFVLILAAALAETMLRHAESVIRGGGYRPDDRTGTKTKRSDDGRCIVEERDAEY